ncbi:hypothetical protein SDC9_65801 [bioreactor metagenome]|uniref:Uncharacterized protein n=1 Tax=bioreactor metagenome TaxID=1076179 RepID=A0A644XUC4_9ZZZZ
MVIIVAAVLHDPVAALADQMRFVEIRRLLEEPQRAAFQQVIVLAVVIADDAVVIVDGVGLFIGAQGFLPRQHARGVANDHILHDMNRHNGGFDRPTVVIGVRIDAACVARDDHAAIDRNGERRRPVYLRARAVAVNRQHVSAVVERRAVVFVVRDGEVAPDIQLERAVDDQNRARRQRAARCCGAAVGKALAGSVCQTGDRRDGVGKLQVADVDVPRRLYGKPAADQI